MRILGVDPGLRHTGLCTIDLSGTIHSRDTIVTKGSLKTTLGVALDRVAQEVRLWLDVVKPEVVAVEHVEWFGRHRKGILILAHLAGLIGGMALERGATVYFFPPRSKPKRAQKRGWTDHEHDAWLLATMAKDLHAGNAADDLAQYKPLAGSVRNTTARGRARGQR